jgi:hypothetical protein
MKKSDLRAIILEELEKSNASLLTEKFASPIIADINNRIAHRNANAGKDLWNATANTYGIAWDLVKDEHINKGANPRRNTLNIFFVTKGTENPYADYQMDYSDGKRVSRVATFYQDGLLGITVGKKVIGFTGKYSYNDPAANKKSKKVDTEPSNYDKVGSGVDAKVWNYKRMLEISTEVFSIDIDAIRNWNVELKSLRAEQKDGALAMQANSKILKDNQSRYKKAIKDIRDAGVEGKELDIVISHLEEAENILTKELKVKIKDTRKGIVYPGWDNPFDLAVNLHRDMVKKFEDFQRYAKNVKDDESDKERKGQKSWYRDYLTEIAHDVKELKDDFDKRIAKAMEQKQVVIAESVLPVNEVEESVVTEASESIITEKSIKCTNKKGHSWKEIDNDGTVECEYCGLRNSLSESIIAEEYIELIADYGMDSALEDMHMAWNSWRNGPMTEPSDIKPAQKEMKKYIDSWFKKMIT